MTSFNLNYLLKVLSLKPMTLGVRASKYEFAADKIQSITHGVAGLLPQRIVSMFRRANAYDSNINFLCLK